MLSVVEIKAWSPFLSAGKPVGASPGGAPDNSAVPMDQIASLDRAIPLGDGFRLEQDGKIVSRNWLGRSSPCSKGQALRALSEGLRQQRISPEEIRAHCHRYPQAALLVLREPSAALSAKLQEWPPASQEKFKQILDAVGDDYRDKGDQSFFLGCALEKLALNEKLISDCDAQGTCLLDNLVALNRSCQADGQAGRDLFAWSLLHSAYSKRTFHQTPTKGTCGAAALGYVLWQESPSRVVRALHDWVYHGQAQTRDRLVSKPPEATDPADPAPVGDQLLQACLMAVGDPDFSYSLVKDQFSRPDGQTRERGLFPEHQERVLNSLSPRDWQTGGTPSQKIREHLTDGSGPIPVALQWVEVNGLHGRHMLTVSRVNDDYVYLRDPAGPLGLTLCESTQQKFADGFQRMSREEFDRRIHSGLLPENKHSRASGFLASLKQACAQSGLSALFLGLFRPPGAD